MLSAVAERDTNVDVLSRPDQEFWKSCRNGLRARRLALRRQNQRTFRSVTKNTSSFVGSVLLTFRPTACVSFGFS
jgi:hypothetical protein